MEKLYKDAKEAFVSFKMDYCCWFAPVRVGLYIIGWLNLVADVSCMISVVAIIGTTNDSLAPIILKVQAAMLEDLESKLMPLLAYSTEMCFTIMLLCGIYRKDVVLLTYYIYYTLVTMIMEFLVYSMVFVKLDVIIIVGIVLSFLLQFYTLLLVRSVIVDIKRTQEVNGKVHYNAVEQQIKEISTKVDVEIPPPSPSPGPGDSVDPEGVSPPKDNERRLETVNEDPKESAEKLEETKESNNV